MLFLIQAEAVFAGARKIKRKQKIILQKWDLATIVHYSPFYLLNINTAKASMRQ
jgi:hypothetical protein